VEGAKNEPLLVDPKQAREKFMLSMAGELSAGSVPVYTFSLYIHQSDNPEKLSDEVTSVMSAGQAFIRCVMAMAPLKSVRAMLAMKPNEMYYHTQFFVPCKGLTIGQKVDEVIQAARTVRAEGHEVELYVPGQSFANEVTTKEVKGV
jgi:hypothetical protein